MAEKSIFDIIKKQNGERFAKTIRTHDNAILDVPNIDKIVRYAGHDAAPLLNYLTSLKNIQIEEHGVYQDPITLLDTAGYNAYYADTLGKQNAIKKYFEEDEELCTFRDSNRYKKYHIINAVKKNVNNIKRKNFPNPKREDEYGTSVISIQILKDGGFISIKNRYNHTVFNSDNTFGSNPDNIITGLSESIKRHFDVDFSSKKVDLPENYIDLKDSIIKYHSEIDTVYFGEDFYIRNGKITRLNKDYEIMLTSFILDMKNKVVTSPIKNSFIKVMNNEIQGKTLKIQKNEQGNTIILADDIQIMEIKDGKLISLHLPTTTEIGKDFLEDDYHLIKFSAPKLKKVGNDFLYRNEVLKHFEAPNLITTGDDFLKDNNALEEINLPQLKRFDSYFMYRNKCLKKFNAPNLRNINNTFLYHNTDLSILNLPKIRYIPNSFMTNNIKLKIINIPNAITIGHDFLSKNTALKNIFLPKVTAIGTNFLNANKGVKKFCAPCLEYINYNFMHSNTALTEINLPKIQSIERLFLPENKKLEILNAPRLEKIGFYFLESNTALKILNLPNIKSIGSYFLPDNNSLHTFIIPKLEILGRFSTILPQNKVLSHFYAPNLDLRKGDVPLFCQHPNRQELIKNSKKTPSTCIVKHKNAQTLTHQMQRTD